MLLVVTAQILPLVKMILVRIWHLVIDVPKGVFGMVIVRVFIILPLAFGKLIALVSHHSIIVGLGFTF